MKTITKYEATDGEQFYDPEACKRHEHNIIVLTNILKAMHPRPYLGEVDKDGFFLGNLYLQHDKNLVIETRDKFFLLHTKVYRIYTTKAGLQRGLCVSYSLRMRAEVRCCPLA